MKPYLLASFAMIAYAAVTSAHAADIGVSVSVGQPGFYGRLEMGDYPPPEVVYLQPRAIEMVPVSRQPIYMRVPPGHAEHWDKHCHEYNACGERVLFVQDGWYNREYAPRYQDRHGERRDNRGAEQGRDHGEEGENNGRGEGHGEGHGRGGHDR